ncbi:hypothetical protein Tco_0605247 [Tanacetum coccineum]
MEVAENLNLRKIEFVWEVIVQTLIGMKNGNNIWSVVRRVSLAAVVYNIWQERNHRIFRGEKSDSSALITKINETIRLKLMNISVKDSNAVRIQQPIENSRGPCTLNMGTCVWFYPTVVRGSSLTQWCNLDAMSYGHKVGFLQVVECQLDDALALSRKCSSLVLDLSVNRSFTLVFVMPFSRAPMVQ